MIFTDTTWAIEEAISESLLHSKPYSVFQKTENIMEVGRADPSRNAMYTTGQQGVVNPPERAA